MNDDVYLGDAVYASTDGYMIKLVANKGSANEHVIWLEPSVYDALVEYVNTVWGKQQ